MLVRTVLLSIHKTLAETVPHNSCNKPGDPMKDDSRGGVELPSVIKIKSHEIQ